MVTAPKLVAIMTLRTTAYGIQYCDWFSTKITENTEWHKNQATVDGQL